MKLKLPSYGSKTDPRWEITCFVAGWDGNPDYIPSGTRRRPGNAHPHSASPNARRRRSREWLQTHPGGLQKPKPEDPDFTLDDVAL